MPLSHIEHPLFNCVHTLAPLLFSRENITKINKQLIITLDFHIIKNNLPKPFPGEVFNSLCRFYTMFHEGSGVSQ